MNFWHDVAAGENAPDEVNVIIEIPKGSQNKYEFDKKTGGLTLDRVLFSPIHYPGDYGMIPQTYADDNDPLDALVLVTYPTYPGTLITARPIGVLKMRDNGEGDDKIVCVPTTDIRQSHIQTIDEIHKPIRDEIAHFFEVYKQLEGKQVIIEGWEGAQEARTLITEAITRYQEQFPTT